MSDDAGDPTAGADARGAADGPDDVARPPGEPGDGSPDAPADVPAPGPRHAAAQRRGPSRRWLLVGGAAVLTGAGAGVAAELVQTRPPRRQRPATSAPAAAVLRDAAAAERALIADLDASGASAATARAVVRQARSDHAAHLRALEALLAATPGAAGSSGSVSSVPVPAPGSPGGPSPARGTARTRSQLRAAELRAVTAGARRGAQLDGAQAALLASIAACEATHAELLG